MSVTEIIILAPVEISLRNRPEKGRKSTFWLADEISNQGRAGNSIAGQGKEATEVRGPFLLVAGTRAWSEMRDVTGPFGGWCGGLQGRECFLMFKTMGLLWNPGSPDFLFWEVVEEWSVASVSIWASVFRVKFNHFLPSFSCQPSRPANSSSEFAFSVFWKYSLWHAGTGLFQLRPPQNCLLISLPKAPVA